MLGERGYPAGGFAGTALRDQRYDADAKAQQEDRAQRFATTTCSPASPKVPELRQIEQQISTRTEYARVQLHRLTTAMDYVCGSQAEANGGPVNATPIPLGFISTVDDGLVQLERVQDALDTQIRRLERVVG